MNLQDFACRISYIVWGGDLAWDRDGGLEELARAVESKFKESRLTRRAADTLPPCEISRNCYFGEDGKCLRDGICR